MKNTAGRRVQARRIFLSQSPIPSLVTIMIPKSCHTENDPKAYGETGSLWFLFQPLGHRRRGVNPDCAECALGGPKPSFCMNARTVRFVTWLHQQSSLAVCGLCMVAVCRSCIHAPRTSARLCHPKLSPPVPPKAS